MLEFTVDVDDVTSDGLIPIHTDRSTRATTTVVVLLRDVEGHSFEAIVERGEMYDADGKPFPDNKFILYARPLAAR